MFTILRTQIRVSAFRRIASVPYGRLAQTFSKLEHTGKTLEKTRILATFLGEIPADDLAPTIAPPSENVKLGVGNSVVVQALSDLLPRKAFDPAEYGGKVTKKAQQEHHRMDAVRRLQIVEELSKVDQDVGELTESVLKNQPLAADRLELPSETPGSIASLRAPIGIAALLQVFRAIADDTNTTRKRTYIATLMQLSKSDHTQAKFIARHLVDNLRIGMSQALILDSVALKFAEDHGLENISEAQDIVRKFHHSVSDLRAVIAKLLEGKGVWAKMQSIESKSPEGTPMKAMLAQPTTDLADILKRIGAKAIVQHKFDGQRAMIHMLGDGTVKIFSRNGLDSTAQWPQVVRAVANARTSPSQSFVLDAEIVGYDPVTQRIRPFQDIKRITKDAEKQNVCVIAFDMLIANGQSLMERPLTERVEMLKKSVKETKGVCEVALSPLEEITDDVLMESLLSAGSLGYEGLMVKDPESTYEPGKRSFAWIKLKKDYLEGMGDTTDLVVLGAYHGTGKRHGHYGSFLLGCYDPQTKMYKSICKVGSGFSMEDLASFHDRLEKTIVPVVPKNYDTSSKEVPDVWFRPTTVLEIASTSFSSSSRSRTAVTAEEGSYGISLRFPRLVRVRDDKGVTDATTEEQIITMYSSQHESVAPKLGSKPPKEKKSKKLAAEKPVAKPTEKKAKKAKMEHK